MRERIALRLLIASSLVAAAAVLAGLLWTASASATATSVAVGSAQAQAGQQGTVSVQAQGVPSPGIGAFTVDVTYTSTIVDPVSCLAGAGFFCNADYAPGKVRCGGFDPYGRTGNVALCSITFQAVGLAGACSNLTPTVQELVDVNGAAITATTSSGSFCISQPPQPTPTPPPPQPTPTQPPAPTPTPTLPPAPVPTQPPAPPPGGGNTGGGTSGNSTSGGAPSGSPAAGDNEPDDPASTAETPVAVASGGTTGGDTPGGSGSSSDETASGDDATGDAGPQSPADGEASGSSGLSTLAVALIATGSLALIAAVSLGWMFRDRLRNLPILARFRYSSRT